MLAQVFLQEQIHFTLKSCAMPEIKKTFEKKPVSGMTNSSHSTQCIHPC